jgi:hypothetical protein
MDGSSKRCISSAGIASQTTGVGSHANSNKGEALHDLRAFLMVANKGQLRRRRPEELTHQALCLNLVTNAVIVWNTVYMAAVIAQLKQEGYPVHDSDLAHVWPTRYAHLNVYGKYQIPPDFVVKHQVIDIVDVIFH